MTKIVGVRFRTAGKVYYFDPKNMEIRRGQHVIVETSRGVEYGHVVVGAREVAKEEVVQPLKPVIRISTSEDDERVRRNREKEREAMKICREKIQKHNLEMKLVDAEYAFDNNKILFYFTADGRVDFRELVKDLAVVFKMRIELRQIGVRDETKILGSVGICGRPLCCHTFLSDFAPVSIKMAKEQNLSLNPAKISGICGRLMCCLKNEQETYEYLNSRMPKRGDLVTMEDSRTGTVHSVNVLRQTVRVLIEENDEKEILELPVAELTFQPRRKKGADRDAVRKAESGQTETDVPGEESGKEKKQNRSRRQDRDKNREQGGKNRDRNRESGQKTWNKDRARGSEQNEQADMENGGEPTGERGRNPGRRGNRNSARERGQNREENAPQEQNASRYDMQDHRSRERDGNDPQEQGENQERTQNQRRGNRERNRRQEQDGEEQREERRRDNRNRRRDRSRGRNRDGQAESQPGGEGQARSETHSAGEGYDRSESRLTGEGQALPESQSAGEGQTRSDGHSQENAEQ